MTAVSNAKIFPFINVLSEIPLFLVRLLSLISPYIKEKDISCSIKEKDIWSVYFFFYVYVRAP